MGPFCPSPSLCPLRLFQIRNFCVEAVFEIRAATILGVCLWVVGACPLHGVSRDPQIAGGRQEQG